MESRSRWTGVIWWRCRLRQDRDRGAGGVRCVQDETGKLTHAAGRPALQTFGERMSGFPVTIKGLSRFTDAALESRAVIDGLADRFAGHQIGTHRRCRPGRAGSDLGLVVVDEEQLFGVATRSTSLLRTHKRR